MVLYTVRRGDCVLQLAHDHGLFWQTLWHHPDNAALRQKRKHPELVLPGDRLTIPKPEPKQVAAATDARHRFRRKGVPAKLRLRFLREEFEEPPPPLGGKTADPDDLHADSEDPDPEEPPPEVPRANVPYHLVIDGDLIEGETDGDGGIEVAIPPNARSGRIILEPGTEEETELELQLGHLDPISEPSGVQQRLANLGLETGDPVSEWTPELEAALATFQERYGLEVTGSFDDATRGRLEELHGA